MTDHTPPTTQQLDKARPAMTMREIREGLGHTVPPPGVPEPTVQTTGYTVSCLPEGHDDRWTYTVQVKYRGNGRYTVAHNLKFADADGEWECEPGWPEEPDEAGSAAEEEWRRAHSFDHDEALRIARRLAPTLTYRGRSVADVLTARDASEQLRRLAAEAPQPEPIVTVHAAPNLSTAAQEALGALVDVAKQQAACDFQHPHPEHPCGTHGAEAPQPDSYEATTGHLITCLAVAGGAPDPDCSCAPKTPHYEVSDETRPLCACGRFWPCALAAAPQPDTAAPAAAGPGRAADTRDDEEAHNSGPGWYEVINPRNATTNIALVQEDGSLYLPEGDALTPDEFAFAAARGNAHRLTRADEGADRG